MSDHVRKQLRDGAVALLTTALPGVTRLQSGSRPIDDGQLPAFRVFARSELVDTDILDRGGVDRRIDLSVVVNVLGDDDTDDVLDAYSATIEETLLAEDAISSIAQDIVFQGAEISDQAKGQEQQGMLQMRFAVLIQTPFGAPTSIET